MQPTFAVQHLAQVLTALLGIGLTACSYAPAFEDCAIACHSAEQCPSGFTCGGEGYCRAAGTSTSCRDRQTDAAMGRMDAPPSAGCSGTAVACTSLSTSTECNLQDGCGFTTPKCTNITDCSVHTTNNACMADNACATDFATSTCKPRAGYCTGTDRASCEASTGCRYSGGCAGTAALCNAYAAQNTCTAHRGCTWR